MSKEDIYFFKGGEETLTKQGKDEDQIKTSEKIRESFSKVLDGKNLSFLLGCGCSSYMVERAYDEDNTIFVEVGIPTMALLAKEFYNEVLDETDKINIAKLGLVIENERFKKNLEVFLGTLHSLYYFYDSTQQSNNKYALIISDIIKKAKHFLLKRCLNEENKKDGSDNPLIELYKSFYRKLLYRNSNLPKPNIFTTNYDLYSETSLDKLGIHYVNGFSGGIKKYFNPTIFNYALAEKMDISQSKWNVIDNFFYLYKIHGSLNWIQEDEGTKLFKVSEVQETSFDNLKEKDVIMIHPTPLKQNASLGSPYSDLFREFQKKLMQTNNVLITIGYSFSDEHINNLIYQAFTIPSFRLIVMGDPDSSVEIAKLQTLNDPRVWIVGGELSDGSKLHYFKGFINNILPDLNNDQIDLTLEETLKRLFNNDKRR